MCILAPTNDFLHAVRHRWRPWDGLPSDRANAKDSETECKRINPLAQGDTLGEMKEPWRFQDPEAAEQDGPVLAGKLGSKWEVRKMTREGNYILRVGKAKGFYGNLKAQRQEQEEERWRRGLERREGDIERLEGLIADAQGSNDARLLKFGGPKGAFS